MSNLLENQQPVFLTNTKRDRTVDVYYGHVRYNDDDKFYVDMISWVGDAQVEQSFGPLYRSQMQSATNYIVFDGLGQPRYDVEFFQTEEAVKRFLMRKRMLDYKISTKYTDHLGIIRQL